MGLADALLKFLDARVSGCFVADPTPGFGSDLAANRLSLSLPQGLRTGGAEGGDEEPIVILPARGQRAPGEAVIVVAEGALGVRRILRMAVPDRIAQENGRLREG